MRELSVDHEDLSERKGWIENGQSTAQRRAAAVGML